MTIVVFCLMCKYRFIIASVAAATTDDKRSAGVYRMASNDDEYDYLDATELTLEELVLTNPLPQRAKVTVGYEDPYNADNSFSTGDVIEVSSVRQ